jgi:hypothetical protein
LIVALNFIDFALNGISYSPPWNIYPKAKLLSGKAASQPILSRMTGHFHATKHF